MGGFCFLLVYLCLGVLGLDSKSQAMFTVMTTASIPGAPAPAQSSASSTAAVWADAGAGETYVVPPRLLEDFSHAYIAGVPPPWNASARDTLKRGLGHMQVSIGSFLALVTGMVLMAILEAIPPRPQAIID